MFRSLKPCERSLVIFLLQNLVSGGAGGAVLGAGLLVLDIASLRTLMLASDQGLMASALLFSGLMVTFGSAAMAVGIMSLGGAGGESGGEGE